MIKKSSLELHEEYMACSADHHRMACPMCKSKGNCAAHGSYKRSLIDMDRDGNMIYGSVEIKRVRCSSCKHTHAILPDYIIPYTTYSLLFVLRVLAEHFRGAKTVEQICRHYEISPSMLYEWKTLFLAHKEAWLGVLKHAETGSAMFIEQIFSLSRYSDEFGRPFYGKTAFSFLQRHKDAARFRHAVF